uniref:L1 transposable element dsRBD-like domain-containing protein n=1 Tax=Equus caballus TaxID=9796 RepID=A0A9L0S389_HORSE
MGVSYTLSGWISSFGNMRCVHKGLSVSERLKSSWVSTPLLLTSTVEAGISPRQKKLTYKGTPIRLSADFSAETLQARREWNDIFKNLKDKNLQPRILYPVKISFKYDGEIKTFQDKQKLREFIATKPPLQEILRKTLIPEKSKKG